jgi:hypothetical protein
MVGLTQVHALDVSRRAHALVLAVRWWVNHGKWHLAEIEQCARYFLSSSIVFIFFGMRVDVFDAGRARGAAVRAGHSPGRGRVGRGGAGPGWVRRGRPDWAQAGRSVELGVGIR